MKLTITIAFIAALLGFFVGSVSVNTACAHLAPPEIQVVQVDDLKIDLPTRPTRTQGIILHRAYEIAKADGLQYPQLLQGIVMQESRAGELASYKVAGQEAGLKPNQRYYGVAQVKLAAAQDVLKRWPSMWIGFQTRTDEEVIARLIDDDTFNLEIASKYLVILRDYGFHTPGALAVAYNRGPGGAVGIAPAQDPYATGVAAHIQKITPIHQYYVQNGDSLSKVAAALHVSQDELYNSNPGAFVNGNRNVLMAGATLTVRKA